jgi:antitoxin component YwqK of YwqJK toxin-antitoxin module
MLKKTIIGFAVLCLFFPGMGSAKEACKYGKDDINYINEKMVERSTGKPANGLLCVHFPAIKLKTVISLKNGLREGIGKTYDEDGKLVIECPYKNGKREGIAKWYHENGKLERRYPYKNDRKEGFVKYYYESGELEREIPYRRGVKEGMEGAYFEGGGVKQKTPYKNDAKEGYSQVYGKNGRLWAKILYRKGTAVSGVCGNGRAFTPAELINWESGHGISCD